MVDLPEVTQFYFEYLWTFDVMQYKKEMLEAFYSHGIAMFLIAISRIMYLLDRVPDKDRPGGTLTVMSVAVFLYAGYLSGIIAMIAFFGYHFWVEYIRPKKVQGGTN